MSMERRLQLLEWARSADAWILEDDSDFQINYARRPLPALQGMDTTARVIYYGSFSTVLFPEVSFGYLILPPALAPVFRAALTLTDRQFSRVGQAVLSDFIGEGYFARHSRRLRQLYATRQTFLLAEARKTLEPLLTIGPVGGGLTTVGWLRPGVSDRWIARNAAEQGVDVVPLSLMYSREPQRGGLLLGFGAFDVEPMQQSLRVLKGVLSRG